MDLVELLMTFFRISVTAIVSLGIVAVILILILITLSHKWGNEHDG